MKPHGRDSIKVADFDITPMVDVIMLLIIFFLLTMHFTHTARVSPMNLPQEKGDVGAQRDEENAFVIDVRTDGAYALGAEVVDLATLVKRAQAFVSGANVHNIVVRADKDRPAADVDRLARALAAAGIRNWKLATSGAGAATQ